MDLSCGQEYLNPCERFWPSMLRTPRVDQPQSFIGVHLTDPFIYNSVSLSHEINLFVHYWNQTAVSYKMCKLL